MVQPIRVGDKFNWPERRGKVSKLKYDSELLSLAYSVIAGYSGVEAAQFTCFVKILGGQKSEAAKEYLEIKNRRTKLKVFEAAAKANMSNSDFVLMQRLINLTRPVMKRRDELAHWQLAKSDRPSKVLVYYNQEKLLKLEAKMGLFKVTKKELVILEEKIELLWKCYADFNSMLNVPKWRKSLFSAIELRLSELEI